MGTFQSDAKAQGPQRASGDRIVIVGREPLAARGMERILERAGVAGEIDVTDHSAAIPANAGYRLALVQYDAGRLADVRCLRMVGAAQHVLLILPRGGRPPALAELMAAADGALVGDETPEQIASIVGVVLNGHAAISDSARQLLRERCLSDLRPAASWPALTPRQAEVGELLAAGAPTKLIAYQLGITEGTAKIHITQLYKAVGVKRRAEFVAAWVGAGRRMAA